MSFSYRNIFLLCFSIAILLHISTAYFSTGYYHPDEHYQILELAAYKAGKTTADQLVWEFHEKIRPGFQPAIAYAVIKVTEGISPFTQAMLLRLLSALLSLFSLYLLIQAFRQEIKTPSLQKWLVVFCCFLWFIPYFNVRFSSENWSGTLFCIGLAYFLLNHKKGSTAFFITGVFMGVAYLCRFQTGILILSFVLWLFFIQKESFKRVGIILSGITLVILVGLIFDRWLYSRWTFTSWNYFSVNFIEGILSDFARQPWWYYFKELSWRGIPPIGAILLLSSIIFWIKKPKHLLTWISLPFFLFHVLLNHKEFRFLFPLIPLVAPMVVLSLETLLKETKKPHWLFLPLFLMNIPPLLISSSKAANPSTEMMEYIYKNYQEPVRLYHTSWWKEYSPFQNEHFYRNANIQSEWVANTESIPTGEKVLLLQNITEKVPQGGSKVYESKSSWINRSFTNPWERDQDMLVLYELTKAN